MCTHTHIYSRGSNCAYLSKVLELVQSSNRIVYPTSCPRTTSISSATRWATLMAATLRGCVHDTHFLANLSFNWVSSTSHWGICVYVYMWVSSMYIFGKCLSAIKTHDCKPNFDTVYNAHIVYMHIYINVNILHMYKHT